MVGAGVVSTLLTKGDLRGLSMLRPTRLHRGILNICLHVDSPGRKARREQQVNGQLEGRMRATREIRAKTGIEC